MLWFVTLVTFVYLARGYPYGPVFSAFLIAVVVNIAIGNRAAGWAAVGMAIFLSGLARVTFDDQSLTWGWTLGVLAWGLAIVAVGELIRVRKANVIEERRTRAERARRQAGEERLRIARELHDVVAHHMSLINVQAGVALHLVDRKPEQVETALATIKDASKEALIELRALIGVLRADGEEAPRGAGRPPRRPRRPRRSNSAGGRRAPGTRRGRHITTPLRDRGRGVPDRPRGSDQHRAAQRRSVGERVCRHRGGGGRHRDSGRRSRRRTDFADTDGSGIRGMRERAQALAGTVDITRGVGGAGTLVRARLPLRGDRWPT